MKVASDPTAYKVAKNKLDSWPHVMAFYLHMDRGGTNRTVKVTQVDTKVRDAIPSDTWDRVGLWMCLHDGVNGGSRQIACAGDTTGRDHHLACVSVGDQPAAASYTSRSSSSRPNQRSGNRDGWSPSGSVSTGPKPPAHPPPPRRSTDRWWDYESEWTNHGNSSWGYAEYTHQPSTSRSMHSARSDARSRSAESRHSSRPESAWSSGGAGSYRR